MRKDDGILHKVDIKMVQYGTGSWSNPWRDKSGAYIFMPDGPARVCTYVVSTCYYYLNIKLMNIQ